MAHFSNFPSAYLFMNKPSNNPLFYYFILFSQTFCLTKAGPIRDRWLLDQPIGREIEKFGHVPLRLISAQNSRMLPTTIGCLMMCQELGTSHKLILSLKRTFGGVNDFCRSSGPEISSGKENKPIWKVSIQKRTANR